MNKKIEELVIECLQRFKIARTDDYLVYGYVLSHSGVPQDIKLYDFLKIAKEFPSFKSVERARRKVQEIMPELKDMPTAIAREEMQQKYKEYSRK